MPTDIAPRLGPIYVSDWEGAGLPFSKGLLATQILATGLETDRAYAIAADVERELVEKRVRAISAGELEERVSSMLTTRISAESATRFLAWRAVKRSGRPFLVALCGVPGVGKSTLATRLAVRLGINHLITTDTIREVLRTVIPETVLPELHVSTYETAPDAPIGESCIPSYYRQARAVAAATASVANRLAAERRNAIFEGVHLIPGKLTSNLVADKANIRQPIVIETLLVLQDEELHRVYLTQRLNGEPGRDGERHLRHFAIIRKLQETLHEAAVAANVPIHDVTHPELLTQAIVDRIIAAASPNPEGRK